MSGHRMRLDTSVGIEIDLISMIDSELTCFLCAESKLTWVLVCVSKLTCFCAAVKIDLDLMCAPNMTSF